MPTLSIGECIRFGWETFKKRPGILIGGPLLVIVLMMLVELIVSFSLTVLVPMLEVVPGAPRPPLTTAQVVVLSISQVTQFAISMLFSLGMVSFLLRAHDDIASVKIGDLWNPQPFWRFLGTYILVMIVTFVTAFLIFAPGVVAYLYVGPTFFMIPGNIAYLYAGALFLLMVFFIASAILTLGFFFSFFLVVDSNSDPINALKESWRITKGNKWRLFLLSLVVLILNVFGMLLFLVGLLVTFPVTWLAFTHAYRTLASQAEA